GRPGLSRLAGQAGFLATALAPKVTETDTVVLAPVIVTAPELATEILSDYGMVALCNVNRLAGETWQELHDYVTSGGGLLIFLGELVDTDHYNEFGFDGGAGIMPGSISAAHHVGKNDALHIAYDALHHPQADQPRRAGGSAGWPAIVRDFEGHPESGLFSAAVLAYLPMEIDRRRAEVVLRYTDGQPAVVASTTAGKKVVVVTTTANMDWTNLPAKGDYVSLMTSLAAYLVRQKGNQRNLFVGEFVREPLTARQTSMPLRVIFPTAPNPARTSGVESAVPTLVPDEQSLTLSHGPIEHAGAVSVSIGAAQRLFAVNVRTSESSLATLDQVALSTGLDVPVQVAAGPEADGPKIVRVGSSDLAPTLLCLVVALLLMEMWMAMRFGAARGSTAPADIRNAGAR
ncbi:MAG: hypothetical protein IID33_01835, partial [Planctomycetes bacterium]|nr:hypothetical protein [Planctomycetota bacterium]